MSSNEILNILEKVNAIEYGHFILSSGKRSSTYCQCAKIFIDPDVGELICSRLSDLISKKISKSHIKNYLIDYLF